MPTLQFPQPSITSQLRPWEVPVQSWSAWLYHHYGQKVEVSTIHLSHFNSHQCCCILGWEDLNCTALELKWSDIHPEVVTWDRASQHIIKAAIVEQTREFSLEQTNTPKCEVPSAVLIQLRLQILRFSCSCASVVALQLEEGMWDGNGFNGGAMSFISICSIDHVWNLRYAVSFISGTMWVTVGYYWRICGQDGMLMTSLLTVPSVV